MAVSRVLGLFLLGVSYATAILSGYGHTGHSGYGTSYQTYDPRVISGYGSHSSHGSHGSHGGYGTGSYGSHGGYGTGYGSGYGGFGAYGRSGKSSSYNTPRSKPTGVSYNKNSGYDFYDTKTPSYSAYKPTYGASSPTYGSKSPSYGASTYAAKPSYGVTSYAAKPSYSAKPSYTPTPSYGSNAYPVAPVRASYSPAPAPVPASAPYASALPGYPSYKEGKSGLASAAKSYGGYGSGYGYDPCSNLPEGDYVLEGQFRGLFPYADPQCNFIKCANYRAHVNPCAIGTKNDDYGKGFCYYHDSHHYCGYPPKKNTY